MKRHIPNFITCLNLLSGCFAVVFAAGNNLLATSYFVALAAILDFADGLVARALRTHSDLGKQLDSLADMISFGLVPGMIIYSLLDQTGFLATLEYESLATFFKYSPFIITVFSALRLAKFNIDIRQTSSFIGLPTPANTLFFASFPLIIAHDRWGMSPVIMNPYVLLVLIPVFSYLLVAEIPLFALKFKNFGWKGNETRYIFLAVSAALLFFFFYAAIPLIIILYIVLSALGPKQTNDSLTKNTKGVHEIQS